MTVAPRPRRRDGHCNPETVSTTTTRRIACTSSADAGGRARRRRGRAARGVDRAVRRSDAVEAGPWARAGRGPDPRHERRRDRPGRGSRALRRAAGVAGLRGAAVRDATSVDEAIAAGPEVGWPLLVRRRTSSAAARWRSSTTSTGCTTTSRDTRIGGPPPTPTERSSWTASWRTRSSGRRRAVRRRGRLDRRIIAARGEAGIHSATAPASCRRLAGPGDARHHPRADARHRARPRGRRPDQHPVRGPRRLAVRDRGQPRRRAPCRSSSKAIGLPLAKMACRLMLGERLADLACRRIPWVAITCRSRRPCCPSTASRAPTRSSGRRCARRRGHGRGPRLPDRVRQGTGRRGRAVCPSRHGLHHGHGLRQVGRARHRRPLYDAGFRICATAGTAQAVRSMGVPCDSIHKIAEARRTSST